MLGYDSEEELLALDMATDVYAAPEDRARLVEQFKDAEKMQRNSCVFRPRCWMVCVSRS